MPVWHRPRPPRKSKAEIPLLGLALANEAAILSSDMNPSSHYSKKEDVMRCLRCQGLMLKEHFLDMEAGFGEMWAQSWRCVSCGAVHDAVIEQNRLVHQEEVFHWREIEDFYLGAETVIRPTA
jgi:hypothetical protein